MEKDVSDLQAANTMATERLTKEEETRERTVLQNFLETESLRGKIRELQNMAHQHLVRKHVPPDGRCREPAHHRTGPNRFRPIGRTEM